jgi:hypothetical protein
MRVHKTANFTVMSNHHFKEKKMSLKAKGLLSLMLSLPDDWNYSVSGLVTLSKDGKDSVMSALAELEEFGYLTRVRLTNSKGQFSGIEYNIYEEPQKDIPISEYPTSATQKAEEPIAENRQQLNTNSINDLFNELCIVLNTNDNELLELYKAYFQVRENINAPLTKVGVKKLVERARRLSNNNTDVEKIILETAIINNWKNIYLPREEEIIHAKQEKVRAFKDFMGLD